MSIKTTRNSKATEQSEDGKILLRNTAGRAVSNRTVMRRGRYIIKGVKMNEQGITRRVERRIPRLAEAAMRKAYRRALASGSKVLIAEAGELKEVSPDGTKRVIKKIEPSVKMQKGLIIKIK